MGLKKPFQSERGNVLLITLVFVGLIGSLSALNLATSKNFLNQMFSQGDSVERSKVLSTTVGLLNEQAVCQSLFPGAFSTGPGDYAITASNLLAIQGRAGERVANSLKNISNFELKSISLSNPTVFTASNGIQYKQFEASFKVGPLATASINSQGQEKTFGLRQSGIPVNKEENLFFVVGSNNRCYFHRNLADPMASGLKAIPQTCKSLGGQFDKAQCNLREFKVDSTGVMLVQKNAGSAGGTVETNKSNLADALCQMELKALQKVGPHIINASNKKGYGWTSFCEKPQWAGCRQDNLTTSSVLFTPGQTYTYSPQNGKKLWSGKAKDLKKAFEQVSKPTVDRRASRALPYAFSSDGWNSTNPNIKTTNGFSMGAANILGGAIGAGLLSGNISDMANILAMNLMWGPVIGGLMMIFGPNCDGAEIYGQTRCVQGYMETERLTYRTEKIKYTWTGPKCKWKDLQTVDPVIDEDGIVKMALKKGNTTPKALDLTTNPGLDSEDLKELVVELNNAKSLPELFALVQGFTGGGAYNIQIPTELLSPIQTRESVLLADLQSRVNQTISQGLASQMTGLKSTVSSIQSSATSANYTHAPGLMSQLQAMENQLDKGIQTALQQANAGGNLGGP